MSTDLRALVHKGARASFMLLAAAFATGCTVGEITYDGRSITQVDSATYYVAFHNATGLQRLGSIPGAQVSWNNQGFVGTATFSFDPNGPNSEPYTWNPGVTNTSMTLPAQDYIAELTIRTDGSGGDQVTFFSAPFTQTYPTQTEADTYTGKQVPTLIYDFELYPAQSPCPAATYSGQFVSVPLCQTDSVPGWALSGTSGKY